MTSRNFVAIAVALATAITTGVASASEISVTIFEFPVGIRNIGMGATGVSGVNQPTTGYYNPATLAWADAAYAAYSYEDIFLDVSMTDIRAAYGIRRSDESSDNAWRLGGAIGYTLLDFNPRVVRTVYLPEGTGVYRERDYYLTSALAGAWERGNESIGAGVAAKYLTLDYSDENAGTWAFDYGFVAAVKILIDESMVRPRAGFSVTNKDTGLEINGTEEAIAGQMRIGIGFDFATPPTMYSGRDVALASGSFDADYADGGRYDSFWSIGWELSILELVQARAGYQWYEEESGYSDPRSNLSFGFGIGWEFRRWIVHADYAHVRPRPEYLGVDLDRDMFGATLGARF